MAKVKHNSGNNEWDTPLEYVELARRVMGSIDLDPASSKRANYYIKAKQYFTIEENGLNHDWFGNIWLNPPYSRGLIDSFIYKLCWQYLELQHINQAIVLVNNCTETKWFQQISNISSAICLPKEKIKYIAKDGLTRNNPNRGQVFLYIGNNPQKFCKYYGTTGEVYVKP